MGHRQPRNLLCEITGHGRESSLDYDYDEIDENLIIIGYKEVPNKTSGGQKYSKRRLQPNTVNEASNQEIAVQPQRAPLVPIHHVQQQGQMHQTMGFNRIFKFSLHLCW